ncbi:hypothetical protein [Paenibacillus marinisediminis]
MLESRSAYLVSSDLIGCWSTSFFSKAADKDTELIFKLNGEGLWKYSRPGKHRITLFKWSIKKDRILFRDFIKYVIEGDEDTEVHSITTSPVSRKYEERLIKGTGLNYADAEVQVINFYNPILKGINSQLFGLITRDLDKSRVIKLLEDFDTNMQV